MDDASGRGTGSGGKERISPRAASPVQRRTVLLAVLIGSCAIAYGLLMWFGLSDRPVESQLGRAEGEGVVTVYLQPLHVDPVGASIQLRISAAPAAGAAVAAIGDRDRLLTIKRGSQVEHVSITAGQPLPEVVFDFDLSGGDVRNYPLDRYRGSLALAVSERRADGSEAALPIHVTLWEGLLGFHVSGRAEPAQGPEAVGLRLEIRRTGAVAIFGMAIYAAMAVMAACALVIGSLVFVGVRRIEVTFAGALGAIIFALPALRAALPGTPPLGVKADVLMFFWAELGAIIALCLFVAAWARRGAQP